MNSSKSLTSPLYWEQHGTADPAVVFLPDLTYTLDDHVAALESWLADSGLSYEPIVLVGHSFGAILALEWAMRQPTILILVLISLPVEDVIFHFDAAKVLRRACNKPVVLLHGKEDDVVPFVDIAAVVAQVPGTQLIGVSGGGHDLLFESPNVIANTVSVLIP